MKKLLLAMALCLVAVPAFAAYVVKQGTDGSVSVIDTSDLSTVIDINEDALVTLEGSVLTGVESTTTDNTLTTSDCGKPVFFNSTDGHSQTLPTPTAGCVFNFVIGVDSTGTNHSVITDGDNDIKGIGFHTDIDGATDGPSTASADTVSFDSNNTYAGDRLNVVSDGTYWYAFSYTSASGAVSFSSSITDN